MILGITGGIGSGKSYVCRQMTEWLNIPVYDCDSQAKRLTATNEDIRRALVALVGPGVYDDHGQLQKGVLAAYLFASDDHARSVNGIIHPAVRRDFLQWVERQHAPVVALESAILYESGLDELVDKVVFVDASRETRIERCIRRDGCTRQQVLERMERQNSDLARERAHIIIRNE